MKAIVMNFLSNTWQNTRTIGVSIAAILILLSFSPASAVEIDRSSLTILGITPGVSKFNDVIRILGETQMWHTGDAALSETRICYRFPDHSRETIILFASNSEMAGSPNYTVSDIRIYSEKYQFDKSSKCSTTKQLIGNIMSKSGLKLGLSQREVYSILGLPDSYEGDLEGHVKEFVSCIKQPVLPSDPYYERLSNLKGCFKDEAGGWEGEPYYDICSGVAVLFINGVLEYLALGSGTSVC